MGGDDKKQAQDDYFTGKDGDMIICDTICDACIYRMEDPTVCKKYPQGKPDELMDPDYLCPLFAVSDFEF